MQVKALFLGFSKRRVKSLVESIEKGSRLSVEATTHREVGSDGGDLGGYDILFLDRGLGERKLGSLLRRAGRGSEATPAVLVYDREPDGRAFAIASEHDCLLYSEKDRLSRGLTAAEIGEAIKAEVDACGVDRRLMEVSLSSGPCSTGR